jgi:hypothetical protein
VDEPASSYGIGQQSFDAGPDLGREGSGLETKVAVSVVYERRPGVPAA